MHLISIQAKSCSNLNQYRRGNMKDQFQPSLRKLANNATLHLETIWLTASDHLILPQVWWNRLRWSIIDKPLVKTQKTSSSPKEALFTGKKGNLARATDYLVAIQLSKIPSRSKADTKNTDWLRGHSTIYDLLQKV